MTAPRDGQVPDPSAAWTGNWLIASRARTRALAPWQMNRLCERMTADLGAEPSLEELGALVGLSPAYVCTAFRASTGLPPHRWLVRHRLDRAGALLRDTNLRVSEIAARVGYGDPSYFARAFRRQSGATPLQYRRERRA